MAPFEDVTVAVRTSEVAVVTSEPAVVTSEPTVVASEAAGSMEGTGEVPESSDVCGEGGGEGTMEG